MKIRFLLVLPALAANGFVLAQDNGPWQCSNGDLLRRVEVHYQAGGAMPCEVRYFKDTEAPGEHQVPWSAQSEAGYCEARAGEFVSKLEGWGWSCSSGGAAPADTPATEADDTDALAPAEEESTTGE